MKLRKILWVSVAAVLFCLTGCADKNGSGEHEAVTILVPAKYVAANTVKLVNLIMCFIILLAFVAAGCVIVAIVTVLRKNKVKQLRSKEKITQN